MHKTEANAHNPNVAFWEAARLRACTRAGAGFLIKGKAAFITYGPDDFMKAKFSWLRAPPWPLPSILPLKPGEGEWTVSDAVSVALTSM